MSGLSGMETYAARLASFSIAHPISKKRSSELKGLKTLKWPHKSPASVQLAEAGFFYHPTTQSPDNTRCFLCNNSLDGWEADDDAVAEHLKHSPDCGWAINIGIEQQIEAGDLDLEDPMDEKLLSARKMTFGSNWPHENKRGWVCKTQKMVESGWYYCPTEESDDFVRCSYCNLSLDGWEPKDNPFNEHQRRSPECKFFSLLESSKPKPGRRRGSRVSKASRMSTQSNLTFMSEDISTAETDVNEDYGVSLSIVETEKPVKAVRGRKRGKAKKPPSKSKAKPMKTSVEEAVQNSSFIEAEDDDFEVKVGALPKITKKGKKRTSDEMDKVNEAGISNPTSSSGDNRNRPAKRRATRTRGSAIHVENALAPSPNFELDTETYASDAENTLTAGASVSRKGIKRGRKKASSTSRKTSAKSTASIASLRSVPSIEDIHDKTPLPSMRPVANSVQLPSTQKTPRLVSSPQSSDVENKPPSSRPSITRPPCSVSSPPASLITRAPLAASTPVTSPSRPMDTRLQSSLPWVTIDLEKIFLGSPIDKENDPFVTKGCISALKEELRSPEKKLTVEEWIQLNAKQGEENLRNECERLVGKFEGEGVRALRVLEGIVCND